MTNRLARAIRCVNLHESSSSWEKLFHLKSLPKSKDSTDPTRPSEPSTSWKAAVAPSFHLLGPPSSTDPTFPRQLQVQCNTCRCSTEDPSQHSRIGSSKLRSKALKMGLRDSTRKLLRRFGRDKKQQEEVEQLQPVALAGASKRSTNRSELCSSFATTAVTREEFEGRRKAVSEGSANWEQCGMCTRSFVAGTSRYAGFCSLDCKSAALYSQSARVYRGRYREEKQ